MAKNPTTNITVQNKRNRKKELLLQALDKNLGNITLACTTIGIERKLYYNWYNEDPLFKEKCDNIIEKEIDWVENELRKQISEGNTTATIFYLKCKAKHRGYVDHQIDVNVTTPLQINYIVPQEEKGTE